MLGNAPRNAHVRPPAAAGRFYPADPDALRSEILAYLDRPAKIAPGCPKAVITPHAGYLYSGPVAGSAFAPCRPWNTRVRRVLLVGPSHFEDFTGLAVTTAEAFATPLGEMPIDRAAVEQLVQHRLARVHEPAHRIDHALEVEVPFLQTLLEDVVLVPILVGRTTGEQVGEALDLLWGGDETAIVISSDLSHYLDYHSAQQVDRETCLAVETLEPASVDSYHACGHLPIQGLLQAARVRHLQPVTLDLRNSGDTSGRRDRVVGYGAWAFESVSRTTVTLSHSAGAAPAPHPPLYSPSAPC